MEQTSIYEKNTELLLRVQAGDACAEAELLEIRRMLDAFEEGKT